MLRVLYVKADRSVFADQAAKDGGLTVFERGFSGDEYRMVVSGDKGSMGKLEEMTSEYWLPPKTKAKKKR